ncbi:uncharacterized protein PAC_19971 [Phialocephala subalpina]|uniref:Heterokaryon incompatibility domain-containing protein n=1 Tax=Phialocephala subalpina TaxID=576137 RepID=A0A1L7XYI6_9HELO|nr:uncharacterized protein PAC_19971 [Phialocephala subalpina]
MDNLCSQCRRIVYYRGRQRAPARYLNYFQNHHASFKDFQDAVDEGCAICTLLWRSISDKEMFKLTTMPRQNWRFMSWHFERVTGPDYLSTGRFQFALSRGAAEKVLCFQRREGISFSRNYWKLAQATTALSTDNIYTGSDESLQQAAKWVSDCLQNHAKCSTPMLSHRALPTRLVHVDSLECSSVRIRRTGSLPHHVSYTTLSHCWGRKSILTLTKADISTLESGIDLDSLPRTFQDAIHVTRFLGIEYIWIDCLCIVQDSVEDWQRESACMDDVYHSSYCNIAATSSSDSNGGCCNERPMYESLPVVVNANKVGKYPAPMNGHEYVTVKPHHETQGGDSKIEEDVLKAKNVFDGSRTTLTLTPQVGPGLGYSSWSNWFHLKHLWQEEVADSALLSRAWVFQERLLAPRVLHFAKGQIFFECRKTCGGEFYPPADVELSPGEIDLPVVRDSKAWLENGVSDSTAKYLALRRWERITSAYNVCALTHESDRFIAIAGLARRLQNDLNCRYIAGLWQFRFLQQLTWVTSYAPETFIAPKSPTWSWLCRPVEINTPDFFPPTDDWAIPMEDMKIEDIDVRTVDGNEMSEVLSGQLRVIARLIPTWYAVVFGDCGAISASFTLRNTEGFFTAGVQDEEIHEQPLFTTICIYRKLDALEGCFLAKKIPDLDKKIPRRAGAAEKAKMTEDLYEKYHEETDKYTFAIV